MAAVGLHDGQTKPLAAVIFLRIHAVVRVKEAFPVPVSYAAPLIV